MPRSPKYPLQPLIEHRDRKVDTATAELGTAVRSREQAEADAVAAADSERRAAEEVARTRGSEAGRLSGGELRAVDLARGDAWELAERQRLAELGRATAAAAAATTDARTAEEQAREGVAQATADRDVVTKDRQRFLDGVRRATDAAEDEEAEDIHRGRKDRA